MRSKKKLCLEHVVVRRMGASKKKNKLETGLVKLAPEELTSEELDTILRFGTAQLFQEYKKSKESLTVDPKPEETKPEEPKVEGNEPKVESDIPKNNTEVPSAETKPSDEMSVENKPDTEVIDVDAEPAKTPKVPKIKPVSSVTEYVPDMESKSIIAYDHAAVIELLNREAEADDEEEEDTFKSEVLSAFKVANYDEIDLPPAEQVIAEVQATTVPDAPAVPTVPTFTSEAMIADHAADEATNNNPESDPNFWENILGNQWQQQQEEQARIFEETLGKGKRTKTISFNKFFDQNHDEEEDEEYSGNESSSDSEVFDELADNPEAAKNRSRPQPPHVPSQQHLQHNFLPNAMAPGGGYRLGEYAKTMEYQQLTSRIAVPQPRHGDAMMKSYSQYVAPDATTCINFDTWKPSITTQITMHTTPPVSLRIIDTFVKPAIPPTVQLANEGFKPAVVVMHFKLWSSVYKTLKMWGPSPMLYMSLAQEPLLATATAHQVHKVIQYALHFLYYDVDQLQQNDKGGDYMLKPSPLSQIVSSIMSVHDSQEWFQQLTIKPTQSLYTAPYKSRFICLDDCVVLPSSDKAETRTCIYNMSLVCNKVGRIVGDLTLLPVINALLSKADSRGAIAGLLDKFVTTTPVINDNDPEYLMPITNNPNWSNMHDAKLLIGTVRHGYGHYNEVINDDDLDLSPSIVADMKAMGYTSLVNSSLRIAYVKQRLLVLLRALARETMNIKYAGHTTDVNGSPLPGLY